jgi:hypothetical protein
MVSFYGGSTFQRFSRLTQHIEILKFFYNSFPLHCRTLANYLLWRLTMGFAPELTEPYQVVKNQYRKVLQVRTHSALYFLSHFIQEPFP